MGEFNLKIIISAFVAIIIGVVLLGDIADKQVANITLNNRVNETLTITQTLTSIINETITSFSGGTARVANFGLVDVTFFGNKSFGTQTPGINLTLHVNFTRSGTIIISQTNFTGPGPYNISYQYISSATGSLDQDDVVTLSSFANASLGSTTAGINIGGTGGQINFTKAGAISLSPGNFSAGSYNASYDYEGDLYVVDSKAYPFLKLIPLFFALVLLAIGIGATLQSVFGFDIGFGKGKA